MSEGIPLEQGLRLTGERVWADLNRSEGIPLQQGLRQ